MSLGNLKRRNDSPRQRRFILLVLIIPFIAAMMIAPPAEGQSPQTAPQQDAARDEPEANPGRPTVSNPATLTPVGYFQFETGTLGATSSLKFSTYYEFNEVIKLAVSRRIEFIESSAPASYYSVNGTSTNGIGD